MANLTAGYVFGSSETVTNTKLGTLVSGGSVSNIVNADIAAGAAISYSKLTLTGNVSDSDISSMAAIAISKISFPGFGLIPSGGIILWSGTIATIPSGWYLCNGSNGTPDLRNRFIIGAYEDSTGVASTTITGSDTQSGGSTTISTSNLPASALTITGSTSNGSGNNVVQFTTNGGSTSTKSTSNLGTAGAYLQPYFALAYIQKA